MSDYNPGDPCPKCSVGVLDLSAQEATSPEYAFTYLRCRACGWSNYDVEYERKKLERNTRGWSTGSVVE